MGYHATTMGEIVESPGFTKPALYQYFPGKVDLFAAVAEQARQELKGILERSYAGRDIKAGSAALFDALLHYVPRFNEDVLRDGTACLAERASPHRCSGRTGPGISG